MRHPRKLAPEEVMRIGAREWAKEGVMVEWKKLLPHEGPRPLLPKRWIVERSLAWICHNRRMSKDYERLCASGEAFSYMLLWLALWWADWLALEDFSYSLKGKSKSRSTDFRRFIYLKSKQCILVALKKCLAKLGLQYGCCNLGWKEFCRTYIFPANRNKKQSRRADSNR